MPRVYVIPASPPCACIEAALQLKGIEYKVTELPPLLHAPFQLARFGRPTVPAMTMGRVKIVGSRQIVRAVDSLRPDPPLYGSPEIETAERWGDEELQPIGRRLIWWSMAHNQEAMPSYVEDARIPFAAQTARLSAPLASRAGMLRQGAKDEAIQADVRALPHLLSRVDAWLDNGVLGGERPNAADLQIASVLRLLLTLGDIAPIIERHGRVAELARRHFPTWPGHIPAGTVPAAWLA